MRNPSQNIEIDISIYESKLRGEIASDLTSLQISFDAISHQDFNKFKYILKQGFTIAEINVPPIDFLKQREINKCFKSIIGSLQDYMDNLIALLKLKNEKITLKPHTTCDELSNLLQTKFKEHLLNVSTDHSLKIPEKLKIILNQPEQKDYKDSVQSFFDIRNGLEHHKGIAKTDRVIKYVRFGLATTTDSEVKLLEPLGENQGIVLRTFEEEITYDKGGILIISKQQLDGIVLSLLIFVIPTMQETFAKNFNCDKAIDSNDLK